MGGEVTVAMGDRMGLGKEAVMEAAVRVEAFCMVGGRKKKNYQLLLMSYRRLIVLS